LNGVQGRHQWRKVHLAMDRATPDIRAVEFTPGSDGDSCVPPDLLIDTTWHPGSA
jgi:hypothetical protein